MRTLFLIAIVLIILFVFYAINIKKEIDSLDYSVDIDSIDANGFDLAAVLLGGSNIKAKLNITVKNSGKFPINISDLHLSAYYNNVLLAKSNEKEQSNFAKIKIEANGYTTVQQTFDINVTTTLINVIGLIKTKQKVNIPYNVQLKWHGIRINTNSNFTIN